MLKLQNRNKNTISMMSTIWKMLGLDYCQMWDLVIQTNVIDMTSQTDLKGDAVNKSD